MQARKKKIEMRERERQKVNRGKERKRKERGARKNKIMKSQHDERSAMHAGKKE